MSEPTPGGDAPPQQPEAEFSDALKALGEAIAAHPVRPEVAFCGIRLFVDAIASGRVTHRDFALDGSTPRGAPREGEVRVPMLAIAGRIVLSFDPTLEPEAFRLAP